MAVFAEGPEAEEAKAAGADIVGGKELIEEIASKSKSFSPSNSVHNADSFFPYQICGENVQMDIVSRWLYACFSNFVGCIFISICVCMLNSWFMIAYL